MSKLITITHCDWEYKNEFEAMINPEKVESLLCNEYSIVMQSGYQFYLTRKSFNEVKKAISDV